MIQKGMINRRNGVWWLVNSWLSESLVLWVRRIYICLRQRHRAAWTGVECVSWGAKIVTSMISQTAKPTSDSSPFKSPWSSCLNCPDLTWLSLGTQHTHLCNSVREQHKNCTATTSDMCRTWWTRVGNRKFLRNLPNPQKFYPKLKRVTTAMRDVTTNAQAGRWRLRRPLQERQGQGVGEVDEIPDGNHLRLISRT